jgi:dihydroxyacid dehydratase/phosphogluconate dehydratase
MVRLSDARISGGSHGLMIVHVSPEAAVGGPIAAVENGDIISLDVEAGLLELEVAPEEIERRLAARPKHKPAYRRGYEALFLGHVLQAHEVPIWTCFASCPESVSLNYLVGLFLAGCSEINNFSTGTCY